MRTTRAPRPAIVAPVREPFYLAAASARRDTTVRVERLARQQHGAIGWGQLRAEGLSEGAISSWIRTHRLLRVHPRVYALGHRHLDLRGRAHAALLYAGDGSGLSHTTGSWHWDLLSTPPSVIHVSAPGQVRSLERVVVHHPRELHVVKHAGLPVTPVGRTLVDIGGMLPFETLQKAIANASYRNLLPPSEAVSALRRGRRGSAAVRRALAQQLPELARTLSPLEDLFVIACDRSGLPSPEMNRMIIGYKVDAIWRNRMVAVELDGSTTHGHPAAVTSDRARELALRRAGWIVLRYSRTQIESEWPTVLAELRSYLLV